MSDAEPRQNTKVALAGPAVVEQLAGARDLLHRATMMLCGADEDVKVKPQPHTLYTISWYSTPYFLLLNRWTYRSVE